MPESEPGPDDSENADCAPTLESLRETIFLPSCATASCHSSADKAGGLDLETVELEAQLVGQAAGTCDDWVRVVPQVPEASLLYAKIAGTAPCGSLMPPPAGLPAEQVACVAGWIEGLEGVDCETCGGDACVDLDNDPNNCGACAHACGEASACTGGSCSCPEGLEPCDGECVDLGTDPSNCGSCATTCAANQVCAAGECSNDCGALTDCGGECVDLDTDAHHCGGCDIVCPNSCEAGECGCPGDGVSFQAEVEPLLDDACANMGCHSLPVMVADLDLSSGNAYAELVDVPSVQCDMRMLVAPGEPEQSYLLDKLKGQDMCSGKQMPKAAPPLSAAELALISEWICRGAPNN